MDKLNNGSILVKQSKTHLFVLLVIILILLAQLLMLSFQDQYLTSTQALR